MARKKKAEEHENLERWMVSYADFMTLLLATFIVLYALAQIDIKEYDKLEESIKAAFNSPIAGGQNLMEKDGMNIINQAGMAETNSMIPPMMEYLSQKYEQSSMEDIQEEIAKALKSEEIEGIEAKMTDRGLVIVLKDLNTFFKSGSATLTPKAQDILGKISKMIKKKFNNHMIRIEGHTDNLPINKNSIYPSNWELSSARAASVGRFMMNNYSMKPNLFTIVGYGDTKPAGSNNTLAGREKNRRVEIVLLKNSVAKYEPMGAETINPQNQVKPSVKASDDNISDAAKELLQDEGSQAKPEDNVIILDEYNRPKNDEVKRMIKDFEKNKSSKKISF